MEVAVIDWKSIESRFVKDEVYEHINAPQWVDFSAPNDTVDDEAWFCRPSCNHRKTAKERTPTSNSKLQRSASVSEILPFDDRNRSFRDGTLKKRGTNQPFISPNTKYNKRIVEDSENQNPNFSTPKGYVMKEAIKSRKKETDDIMMMKNQAPRLKSTLSARNLFSGGDLLNKVAEFCNELKKLATRGKDGAEDVNGGNDHSRDSDDKEKERKPLLLSSKAKSEKKNYSKEKQRWKKRNDDAENTPIVVDVKNIKHKEEESLLPIRTSPPTPQCFSANGPTPKSYRSKPQERGILKELKAQEQPGRRIKSDELRHKNNQGGDEKEATTLDVFWFLKPCTNSS